MIICNTWFIYFEPVNSEHILQAIYYALIKYGRPNKIFIRNMHFDSYIARTGKIKKADINCDRTKLVRIGIYTNASYSFYIPDNINTTSINFDLKELEFPDPNTSIFDFKEFLDYHVQAIINQRTRKNKHFNGKSPNELWIENYVQQELPDKQYLVDMCLRSKNPLKIGRNGIFDSVTQRWYWGDWISFCTSKTMYFKRDIFSKDNGYLYDGKDGRGLGEVYIFPSVPALCRTPEDFELLRQAMAIKPRALKNTNLFIEELNDIPFEEQVENYKAVCDKEIPKHNPKIIRLFRHTKIENAIKKIKEQEEAKEIQDKVYAQLLADIEANEKGE